MWAFSASVAVTSPSLERDSTRAQCSYYTIETSSGGASCINVSSLYASQLMEMDF